MGTNYYLRRHSPATGPIVEDIHIGKSSYGWTFALCLHPEYGINELSDWVKLFNAKGSIIYDEYGKTITPEVLLNVVTNRGDGRYCQPSANVEAHSTTPHPLFPTLNRRVVDSSFCVGYGTNNGTYDLVVGEFC